MLRVTPPNQEYIYLHAFGGRPAQPGKPCDGETKVFFELQKTVHPDRSLNLGLRLLIKGKILHFSLEKIRYYILVIQSDVQEL